jgi:hypothetical protein
MGFTWVGSKTAIIALRVSGPWSAGKVLARARRKRRAFLRACGKSLPTLDAKGFHTMSLHAQTIPGQPAIRPLPAQPQQPQQPGLPPEIPVPTDPPLGTPPLEIPPEQAPQHS